MEVVLVYKEQWQLKVVLLFQVQIFTADTEDQQHSYQDATAKDTLFFHDGRDKFIC